MQSEAIRRCIGSSFGDVDVVVGSAEAGSPEMAWGVNQADDSCE